MNSSTNMEEHAGLNVKALASDRKLTLLDDIDKLRSQGVDQFVNLPQLIVCGDQSSGKSSVLEAISGIPFPIKDTAETRFATEVILRRSSDKVVTISIVPSIDRSAEEQERLATLEKPLTNMGDISTIIHDAKAHMGVNDTSTGFSADVLRIEVSGPDQPHLTIVDLPGLIHSGTKNQSDESVRIVQDTVKKYMENRRSIILAIVTAKNDHVNQIVLKMSREVDPQGRRTMGVITKPDTLPIGSKSETGFLNLAQNTEIPFRLGWHVLRNRRYETQSTTTLERDEVERDFLAQGVWKDLPRDTVGIVTLRPRLSDILFAQIRAELPTLIEDIEGKITGCRDVLKKLGPSRETLDQQRQFLLKISQEFTSFAHAALDGSYGEFFFGEPRATDGSTKRLRAVVSKQSLDFAARVRIRGHARRIVDDGDEEEIDSDDNDRQNAGTRRETVSRSDFIDEIKVLLVITRGRELPGLFNPMIVADLFREQSKPWDSLARHHLNCVWKSTRLFLDLLMSHVADDSTSHALLSQVIDPLMDAKLVRMNEKLDEILTPYKVRHPITYNHYFTETIQKTKKRRHEAEMKRKLEPLLSRSQRSYSDNGLTLQDIVSALDAETEADMDRYACSEILDCMEAFYKVAMKTMVDNVAVYAIEETLLTGISELFPPSYVLQMDERVVKSIAAESVHSQALREQTQKKLEVLEKGLSVCRVHVDRKSLSREGDTEPDLYDNTDAERGSQAEDTGNAESQSDAIAVNKDQEPSPIEEPEERGSVDSWRAAPPETLAWNFTPTVWHDPPSLIKGDFGINDSASLPKKDKKKKGKKKDSVAPVG